MGGLFSISRRVYVKSAAIYKKVFYVDMPNGSFAFSRLKVYVELALDYAALNTEKEDLCVVRFFLHPNIEYQGGTQELPFVFKRRKFGECVTDDLGVDEDHPIYFLQERRQRSRGAICP